MNLSRLPYFVGAVGLGCLFFASGCSRPESASEKTKPAVTETTGLAVPPDITVLAGDNMKFSVTRIEATAGEVIHLTLTNNGRMPKAAMGHNWVLLTKSADARAYSMAAMSAIGTEYLPAAESAKVIAHTKLLGPGESETITFNAPAEPGEYPFVCSFPGHFLNGMAGVLVVK